MKFLYVCVCVCVCCIHSIRKKAYFKSFHFFNIKILINPIISNCLLLHFSILLLSIYVINIDLVCTKIIRSLG